MFASLGTRITLMSAFLLLLSMTWVAGSTLLRVTDATMAATDQQVSLLADSYTRNISQWINSKKLTLSALKPATRWNNPRPMIETIKGTGGFDDTYIGYPDKRFIALYDLPGFDPTSRPWYKNAVATREPVVTSPFLDVVTKKLILSFAVPVFEGDNGPVTAVMGADMQMETIVNTILGIRPTPGSYAFLFDYDGTIITHPDTTLTLKQVSDIYPGVSQEVFLKMISSLEYRKINTGQENYLMYVRAIPDATWLLGIMVNEEEVMVTTNQLSRISIISSIVIVLVSFLFLFFFIRRIVRRLITIRDALDDIVSGEGDLTKRLPTGGRNELSEIARGFNRFVDKISDMMHRIRQSSAQVQLSSSEIAGGNADLSGRTEQQAASLEETSAAMDEITSTVQQNEENAQQASAMAQKASGIAAEGGSVMGEVVTTMEQINDSSQRIVEIISVIDSIAFQTNILALNAAIEAARAGEQGRGFAVVASEVRVLAQRSSQAAKEIQELITNSADRVASGVQYVEKAGATMEQVVSSVNTVTNVVAEITLASQQQGVGIGNVARAITEIEQGTQKNATLVQEAATAAESLRFQAEQLNQIVGFFKLQENHEGAPDGDMPAVPEGEMRHIVDEPVAALSHKPRAASLKSALQDEEPTRKAPPQLPDNTPKPRIMPKKEGKSAQDDSDFEEF